MGNNSNKDKETIKVVGRRGYSDVYILPVKDLKKIDPISYFITTGDALTKMGVLINDVKELLSTLEYLRSQLIGIKGSNKWLETEITDGGDKIQWPEDLMLLNNDKWPLDCREYKTKYSQGSVIFKIKNPKVNKEYKEGASNENS